MSSNLLQIFTAPGHFVNMSGRKSPFIQIVCLLLICLQFSSSISFGLFSQFYLKSPCQIASSDPLYRMRNLGSSFDHHHPSILTHKMSPDLDLDPSDPLNLLLNNTSQIPEDDGFSDWSKFSTLWDPSVGLKTPSSGGTTATTTFGFNDLGSLGMDMDFDPSMTIEPSVLHYDFAKFAQCMNIYATSALPRPKTSHTTIGR